MYNEFLNNSAIKFIWQTYAKQLINNTIFVNLTIPINVIKRTSKESDEKRIYLIC